MEAGAEVDRIAVVGTTGSGKTTVAARLSLLLRVPHVELDALFWRPGWRQASAEEFRRDVLAALAGDGWVVDGNYGGKLGNLVLERATLVVWLDVPLRTILLRLLRRTVMRIRSGDELWGGNRETWRKAFLARDSILVWALTTHRRRRRELPVRLAPYPHLVLRSPREVEEWLASLRPTCR